MKSGGVGKEKKTKEEDEEQIERRGKRDGRLSMTELFFTIYE